MELIGFRPGLDDTVRSGFFAGDILHAENRAMGTIEFFHHLLHHRLFRINQIVGQNHRKRLVAHHRLRAQYRVAQAQRFSLANVDTSHVFRNDRLHQLQHLLLVACFEFGFQFVGFVEVILNRALVAAGDENHLGDACLNGLFHRVLNQRLVDYRHHFLGAGLGRGKKTSAHSGYRKYRLANFLHA